MRLTIISDDQLIGKDGVNYSELDMTQLASNVHAVQWYDTWGEVEYKPAITNGQKTIPQNAIIESISDYQWAVDAWQVAHDAALAAAAAEAAALAAALAAAQAAEESAA